MSILSDRQIQKCSRIITPFVDKQVNKDSESNRVISYGLSSYGYDIRCANEFKIFTNVNNAIVDPKNFDSSCYVDFIGDVCIIPPNSFILTRSLEYISMPADVTAICIGKSTYARSGAVLNITPIEAAWRGYITLEISNTTSLPLKIYANEGIAQLIFFRGDPCMVTYADRNGKYQNQVGVVPPRV